MRLPSPLAALMSATLLLAPLAARAGGDEPVSSLVLLPPGATISGCGCFEGTAFASLAAGIRHGDVLILIDLTGSMSQERQALVDNIVEITTRLAARIPDLRMGLVSYRDYHTPGALSSCGYTGQYGGPESYPYELHLPLTSDLTEVHDAVNALPLAQGGSDGPEAYARALWEAVNDPAIGWDPGRRNVLLNFGDNVPHDCVLFECLGIFDPWTFGVDPGPDELPGTPDDLPILQVMDDLDASRTVLLHVDSSGGEPIPLPVPVPISTAQAWNCWAGRTGGECVEIEPDGSVPSHVNLAALVEDLLRGLEVECSVVEVAAEAGWEDWLDEGELSEEDVELPAEREIPFRICVPDDTPAGTYEFDLELRCAGETLAAATVQVVVTDPCGEGCADVTPPELVSGTIAPCHETEDEAIAAALAATTAPFEDGEPTWEVEVLGLCPAQVIVTARDECLNESSVEYETDIDDAAPAIDGVPADASVACDAVPSPASPSASDDCDPSPSLTFSELRIDGDCPDRYQLVRSWEALDACGHSSTAEQVLEVRDDQGPVIDGVPEDETVECDEVPPPASPTVSDGCDPDPALDFAEARIDGSCPGEYRLLRDWTAVDRCGNVTTARQVVDVVDTTPPLIEASGEDEHCLWPPNHRYVRFELSDFAPVVSDACSGPVEWRFEGCASSQPDDGLGDGRTTEDCLLGPDGASILVRAERLGNEQEARRYAILAVAVDACGNESEPAEIGGITVPHDQREHPGPCRSALGPPGPR